METSYRPSDATANAEPASDRTGPFGRAARLVIATIAAYALVDIIDEGGVLGFRRLVIMDEPGVWLIIMAMTGAFFVLVGALSRALGAEANRYQVAAAVALTAAVLVAIAASLALSGSVWGFPLSDLVWGFAVVMLLQTVVASLIAIRLGTPGCEVGVWTELIAGARYGKAVHVSGPACIVGLHFLDAWEAARRRRA